MAKVLEYQASLSLAGVFAHKFQEVREMNRRSFLKTTGAVTATSPLLARELSISSVGEPDIKHVVVVMMENRSFDHLLGWLPGSDGKQAGLDYPDKSGVLQPTHELAPDYTGCSYPDPDHSYSGGRTEIDAGKMDGFLQPTSNGLNAIGYYQEKDLPFRSALARNYTTCDRYFPSMMGPTFPNRIFQHAGATDRLDDDFSICTLPTIWDQLAAQGVSHRYYFSNIPFVALWGLKYVDISALYANFLADCAAGTLPAVSFVEPTFTTLDNLDEDDHPFSDVRNGDAFLAKTFKAVATSPNWPNTVLIVNYDEWGGFYDHVPPPRALAPNNVDPDLVDGKALLGCRVPCIVASPWTTGNPDTPRVSHEVFDHTSVLKLIESVWNVPAVAAREMSNDVGNLLDVLDPANYQPEVPNLPNPGYVIPSSLCLSSTNPSGSSPLTNDDEPTVFLKMIASGMLKGFPGQS
ncbi:MAG: alkaline phosphatase family protein [Bryobacteraceae bacterium]